MTALLDTLAGLRAGEAVTLVVAGIGWLATLAGVVVAFLSCVYDGDR